MLVTTPAQRLLFTTVRLETVTPAGRGLGTASIFGHVQGGYTGYFLVTNKHVVKDAYTGTFFFIGRDGDGPALGRRVPVTLTNFAAGWHGHPDPGVDIAVAPILPILQTTGDSGRRIFITDVSSRWILSREQLWRYDAVEDVVFVGYPNGYYDRANLTPIVRRGTTATPLQLDYDGRPIFLVDASVFPGSSGSPVFSCAVGSAFRADPFGAGRDPSFLGVLAGVLYRTQQNTVEEAPVPTDTTAVVRIKELLDLGVVYKASTVVETIEDFLATHDLRLPEVEESQGATVPASPA
jgi:hypothetical protein